MKGIILAGGSGKRLFPLTKVTSKQLQAVFDKPMIYYPLTTLIAAGIREISIITTPNDKEAFEELLQDGSQLGVNLNFIVQEKPYGIANAIVLAEKFLGDSNFTLILGDNIFSGGSDIPNSVNSFKSGALVFAYHVPDPERYAVLEFNKKMEIKSLVEKPIKPKSNYAVPGFYIYDKEAIKIAKNLKPSSRGEYEITDINLGYLEKGLLKVHRLSRGFAWLDSGTSSSLHNASNYVAAIEQRQGMKIGCPEEASLIRGFINLKDLNNLALKMPECEYSNYLLKIVDGYQTGML
tara:strand:+ start:172 stop:1050 length:879 start_codon:yes stop_codon:yes gene_type:complete